MTSSNGAKPEPLRPGSRPFKAVCKRLGISGETLAFARFCGQITLDTGKPFYLYPEQLVAVDDYFRGIRETLILIPKKNGKTTLLAALALYHLLTTPNAACYIAASSKDQATILYDQAKGFVQRTDWLAEAVTVRRGTRELRSKFDTGFIRVLAADADTADGVLPTLALVDELHRQKSSELYTVFRDGLIARDGQMITISTAGDDEESPLGQLRRAAHALPGQTVTGAYRYAHTDDFCLHEWALPTSANRSDMKVVKTANPAPWHTVPALQARFDSPSTKPWQWARFACGVWVFGEYGAISETEWRACEDREAAIPDGTPGVVIPIDLAWKWDTTAICPMLPEGERNLLVNEPTIIVPPGDGTAIDVETIKDVLRAYAGRWPEVIAVIDPEAGGEQLLQWIQDELGWTVITHSQKPAPMARSAARLSEAISEGRLRHPGDPDLTRHVLAAAARPVGEGWKLVKPKRSGAVIDGAVALAMGADVILGGQANREPVIGWV